MSIFISGLSDKLDDFLAYKNALGIKYDTAVFYLRGIDRYNFEHGNCTTLTREIAEDRALVQASKTETQDRSWISLIREFGRYLKAQVKAKPMF